MPVDMGAREGRELVEHDGILREEPGKIHQLGKPDHLLVPGVAHEIVRGERRPRGLEVRRRHAGRKLDAKVEGRRPRRVEKILEAGGAEDVADLVRIADRRRRAARQDAPLELVRRHQRRFAVDVRVDEPRHGDAPAGVDLDCALVALVGADDAVAAHRDVADLERAVGEVEDPRVLDDEVGLGATQPLVDDPLEVATRPRRHPSVPFARRSTARIS